MEEEESEQSKIFFFPRPCSAVVVQQQIMYPSTLINYGRIMDPCSPHPPLGSRGLASFHSRDRSLEIYVSVQSYGSILQEYAELAELVRIFVFLRAAYYWLFSGLNGDNWYVCPDLHTYPR